MLSFIGVHPAGPDHIRGRVRDGVKPVNTSLKLLEGEGSRGRCGKLSWIGGQGLERLVDTSMFIFCCSAEAFFLLLRHQALFVEQTIP